MNETIETADTIFHKPTGDWNPLPKFRPFNFGEFLKDVREFRKLTQTELAERAGLKPSAVSHFECGRRKPSFEVLVKLADALGIEVLSDPRTKGKS